MEKRWNILDDEAAAATRNLTEIMILKRQSEDAAMRLCLGKQLLLPSSSQDSALEAVAHIRVGSYYEIDHSNLPIKTPDQLKLVRVIMVSKKSKCSVSLRYSSVYSLRAHFSSRNRRKLDAKMLPSLDEQFAMESEVAGDVLYRRIPPHEVALQRNCWSFWVVFPFKEQEGGKTLSTLVRSLSPIRSPTIITSQENVARKKGSCWSEINSPGMVQWGRRRQVRFLGPHVEERQERILSRIVEGEGEERGVEDNEEDDNEGREELEEKEIILSDGEKADTHRKSSKRKQQGASCKTQMSKKLKHENQQIVIYKPNKKREVKNSIERWSVQRYHLAEENMLKIMTEKGAVIGKPMLRPELRAEARKLIGDTGLLDHLLKHMAGKVAPGGKERFMRRHNADGAMEYWLESADLMDIRKEAGVQDPYWTPPPGWKLGDNPTQDPICARELKDLREEIVKLKKSLLENQKTEDLACVTIPHSSVAGHNLVQDATMLLPLKEKYVDLMNKKAKVEGQLNEIAKVLYAMEEEMGKLKCMVEDPELVMGLTPPPLGTEREKEQEKSNKTVLEISDEEENDSNAQGKTPAFQRKRRSAVAITENKASKIQTLKSGFRICKPQGTFLWPNMSLSRQVVPIDDILEIPTPPAVDSSTTKAPHLVPSPEEHRPQHTSTVKPSAEGRSSVAVNFSRTPVTRHPPPLPLAAINSNRSSSTTTETALINLNEVPGNPHHEHGFYGSDNQSHISSCPLTYQRRHHNLAASSSTPRITAAKKENEMKQIDGSNEQQQRRYMSMGAGNWLALSIPSSSQEI